MVFISTILIYFLRNYYYLKIEILKKKKYKITNWYKLKSLSYTINFSSFDKFTRVDGITVQKQALKFSEGTKPWWDFPIETVVTKVEIFQQRKLANSMGKVLHLSNV